MTNEEAIEYAKATNYCAGCTDYECIDDGCEDCEHKIFFKMAIEALEKQIPKKPWKQSDDDTCIYYHWECPTCGEWLPNGRNPHHCKCGQKLDWN